MNPASAWKGIKQRINWALNKSEHLSIPERQKQREIKSAKQIAIVESALAELSAIKQRAEEYRKQVTPFERDALKAIDYIIKGEGK